MLISSEKNETVASNVSVAQLSLCGANFCPNQQTTDMSSGVDLLHEKKPDPLKVHVLMGVFLVSAVLAAFVVLLFVDSLER